MASTLGSNGGKDYMVEAFSIECVENFQIPFLVSKYYYEKES
jgi:hypothetical protein